MNNQTASPVIVFIRGLPGSGKSHLTNALRDSWGDRLVVLDPDAIDYQSPRYAEHVKQQLAEGVDPKLHAYRYLRAQAYQAITDKKIIIWNQPFSNLEIFQKMIGRLEDHANAQHTKLNVLIIELTIDPEVAYERVKARKQAGGHGPSPDTFQRFVRDFTSYKNLGFKTLSIDGDGDVSDSVARVNEAIKKF